MIFEKVPLKSDDRYINFRRLQHDYPLAEFTEWISTKRKDVLAEMVAAGMSRDLTRYMGPIWNYCVEHRPELFIVWRLLR